jgi:hypothetical protein
LIIAAKVHAALSTALIAVAIVTSEFLLLALVYPLAVELALLGAACWRHARKAGPSAGSPWLFTGLTAALVGGWASGVLVWSERLPKRVAAAAELAAQGKPYCLDVLGRPATRRRDLTGLRMRAPSGWSSNFHALLVIGESDRTYMNWSYRTGKFELMSADALARSRAGEFARCTPARHFARSWIIARWPMSL